MSIAWFLISWWPHDGFHRSLTDMWTLVYVEYAFHLTLMIAGAILALAFARLARQAATAPEAARPEVRTGLAEPQL